MTSPNRQFPRLSVTDSIVVLSEKFARGTTELCQTADVSAQGIRFISQFPHGVGSVLDVICALPRELTGKPRAYYRFTGVVIRLQALDGLDSKFEVAVQFRFYRDIEVEVLHQLREGCKDLSDQIASPGSELPRQVRVHDAPLDGQGPKTVCTDERRRTALAG